MSGGHKKLDDPNRLPVDLFGPYPGYWTELVITNNWPPNWEPAGDWGANNVELSARAAAKRDERLALGDTGTIGGLSSKSDARAALHSADGAGAKWMPKQ